MKHPAILPAQHAQAEVSWRLLEGPGDAVFENNNANGPEIGVHLEAAGRHTFLAEIRSGELTISRELVVNR